MIYNPHDAVIKGKLFTEELLFYVKSNCFLPRYLVISLSYATAGVGGGGDEVHGG
jgi:hypothetical protein